MSGRVLEIDLNLIPFDEGIEMLDAFGKKDEYGDSLVNIRDVAAFVKRTLPEDVRPTLMLGEGLRALQQIKKAFDEVMGVGDDDDTKASSSGSTPTS